MCKPCVCVCVGGVGVVHALCVWGVVCGVHAMFVCVVFVCVCVCGVRCARRVCVCGVHAVFVCVCVGCVCGLCVLGGVCVCVECVSVLCVCKPCVCGVLCVCRGIASNDDWTPMPVN